jgi:hypothetical protein
MVRSTRRLHAGLLLAGVAAWIAGFAVLASFGTWALFAIAGPVLAGLALALDPAARALLRPSWTSVPVGIVAGVLMILATHLAYAPLAEAFPEVRQGTVELYRLLNVWGYSSVARAALVAVVAASEEIVFRGAILTLPDGGGLTAAVSRRGLGRVLGLAGAYAAATATLGSPLLVAGALLCGATWGFLRVATGSAVAPILAHLVWDLAVLSAWPLA